MFNRNPANKTARQNISQQSAKKMDRMYKVVTNYTYAVTDMMAYDDKWWHKNKPQVLSLLREIINETERIMNAINKEPAVMMAKDYDEFVDQGKVMMSRLRHDLTQIEKAEWGDKK